MTPHPPAHRGGHLGHPLQASEGELRELTRLRLFKAAVLAMCDDADTAAEEQAANWAVFSADRIPVDPMVPALLIRKAAGGTP
jgi:hypothetical protein